MVNDGLKYCEDYLLRKEGCSKVSDEGKCVFYILCFIVREIFFG